MDNNEVRTCVNVQLNVEFEQWRTTTFKFGGLSPNKMATQPIYKNEDKFHF